MAHVAREERERVLDADVIADVSGQRAIVLVLPADDVEHEELGLVGEAGEGRHQPLGGHQLHIRGQEEVASDACTEGEERE